MYMMQHDHDVPGDASRVHERVVGVALRRASEEGRVVPLVQRGLLGNPADEEATKESRRAKKRERRASSRRGRRGGGKQGST